MSYIPYGRQWIDEEDIEAVVKVLRSDWLTTGPKVAEFEELFAQKVGARYAVAVSSGTAALHCAMYALGIGPADEVIVPTMTFAATANCVVCQGGTPVFADVEGDTLLIDLADVEQKRTDRTKAVIAVDYAGQPCDYDTLRDFCTRHGFALVADACHSLGATYKGRSVGSLADLSCFSFHPVKHITTGEGGMITTDNPEYARRMKMFRNHGITTDHRERTASGSWFYEMKDLGYNYRITDFQCALGISQLNKLYQWTERRRHVAACYDDYFSGSECVQPLRLRAERQHAYHLYVVKFVGTKAALRRDETFQRMRENGIGVNVHYIPVHLHPYYRRQHNTRAGLCPAAEAAYPVIMSLPMYPLMTDDDVFRVVDTLTEAQGCTRTRTA